MATGSAHRTPIESPDLSFEELRDNVDVTQIENKWRLFEARQSYAWNYFDFHAKQRTTMFNFFLLFAGLFVNAYVTVFKEHFYPLLTLLALFGVAITVIFIFLERRNEELVHVAEDVLESLESDVLFAKYDRDILWPRRRDLWGRKKKASRLSRPLGILLRQTKDDSDSRCGVSQYSHGTWLPRFQYFIGLGFLILAIFPWVQKCFF